MYLVKSFKNIREHVSSGKYGIMYAMKAKTTIDGKAVWFDVEEIEICDATDKDAEILSSIKVVNHTSTVTAERVKPIPIGDFLSIQATHAMKENYLIATDGELRSTFIPLPREITDEVLNKLAKEEIWLDQKPGRWIANASREYLKAWLLYYAGTVRGFHKNTTEAVAEAYWTVRRFLPSERKGEFEFSINGLRKDYSERYGHTRKELRDMREKESREKQLLYKEENEKHACK